MITFRKLDHTAFKDVFRLHRDFDPSFECMTLDHFVVYLYKIEGIVIESDEKVIASIYFDNFAPGCDIIIHCVSDPAYRARWINRKILHWCHDFVYEKLGLPRMTGYAVDGLTDKAGRFLEQIGFQLEGCKRKAAFVHSENRDLRFYGLLKEESRW